MSSPFLAIFSQAPAAAEHYAAIVTRTTGQIPIVTAANLRVFASLDHDVLILPDAAGVVLGALFGGGKERSTRIGGINRKFGSEITATRGQVLIDRYWGGYVAILPDSSNGTAHVVREPSGHMPCYYIQIPGGTVVTSDIETLYRSGLPFPEMDFDFLPGLLCVPDLRTEQTGFMGFKELLPGFSLLLNQNGNTVTACWSPWNFVPSGQVKRTLAADQELPIRQTVGNAVRAWAGSYDHVGLGLSGGLDSSIVAACLHEGPSPWTAVTVATNDAEGDERAYARVVAKAFNARLIEAFHDSTAVDLTAPSVPHLARPSGNFLVQSMRSVVRSLGQDAPIDAYFTGIGGDNLFCYIQSATPLIDRIYSEGVGSGAWRTLEDICKLTGASYWDVLKMAGKRVMLGDRSYRWKGLQGFIEPSAFDASQHDLHHQWLAAPADATPGKAVHIAMLLRLQGTLDGFSGYDDIPIIAPLYSQPVMELCLSVPTWNWCENGQNRSLARQAFRSILPAETIRRRTKGGPDGFAMNLIEENKALIGDLLLDGQLAKHGFINSDAVARALTGSSAIQTPDHILLANLVEAEAWLNHWTDRQTMRPKRNAA